MSSEVTPIPKFTASCAGLDRDAILFEAGRATGKGQRNWKAVAGFLAASQAVTLALLLPGNQPHRGISEPSHFVALQPGPLGPVVDSSSWCALRCHLDIESSPLIKPFDIAPGTMLTPLSGRDVLFQ